jgi:hypothetical protein
MIGGVVEPFETNTYNRRYVAYRRPLSHQESEISEDTGFWRRLRFQFSPPKVSPHPHAVFYAVGANMSVRVDAAREAGGFTEARGAGEEESLARPLRARYGPQTVQIFPEIVMKHNFHPSLRDTWRRSQSYGRTNGREWVKDRDIPSVSPLLPSTALVAVLVAIVSPFSALAVVFLSPFVLYRRWWDWYKDGGSREALIYPYVQASEELATNLGFIQGATRELRSRRMRRLDSVP